MTSQGSDSIDDTESRVRRIPGGRLPRQAAALSLLAVAVAVITWMAVRSTTTSVSGLTDELVGPRPTADEVSSDGGRAGADGLVADRPERTDGAVVIDPDQLDPALAGYRLLAARNSEFIDIDLATGEAATHGLNGRLIGLFDDRLLLVDPAVGISTVPVDDPDAEPEAILPMESDGSVVASAVVDVDGVLHVTSVDPSDDPFRSSMTRLDLRSGREQRVDVWSAAAMGLVEVPGAGLFELTEDGFRPLTDASVRFFGLSHVLAERCDDPEQCRRFWLQRATGVRVTRPLPRFRVGYVLGRSGRVAVGIEPDAGFFDVRLAAEISIDDPYRRVDEPWYVVEDLTEDERFLAAVVGEVGSDVVIHDLDTGNEVRLELGRSSPLSRLLFVPRVDGR